MVGPRNHPVAVGLHSAAHLAVGPHSAAHPPPPSRVPASEAHPSVPPSSVASATRASARRLETLMNPSDNDRDLRRRLVVNGRSPELLGPLGPRALHSAVRKAPRPGDVGRPRAYG